MTLKRRMSKRTSKQSKLKKKKTLIKTIKKRRKILSKLRRNKTKRAGSPPKMVECCVCSKNEGIGNTLIPRKCLAKHGVSAHRICQECWWDNKTGFALEGTNHTCPGCVKGLPINKDPKGEIIDLTEDE